MDNKVEDLEDKKMEEYKKEMKELGVNVSKVGNIILLSHDDDDKYSEDENSEDEKELAKEETVKRINFSKDSPFMKTDLDKDKNKININKQICNYCYTYLNEINEHLDNFEKKYFDLQKELIEEHKDKYDRIKVLDYESLSNLRVTCCNGHLYLCKIEKIDFLKICQGEGFY